MGHSPLDQRRRSHQYERYPRARDQVRVASLGDRGPLHLRQRAKVDAYGGGESELRARLFIVARMLELQDGRLCADQTSTFLGHNTVLTFQEEPGDVWDPSRQRIRNRRSRLRVSDASFLAYSLLDAIIDHFFPILEYYGERMDALETLILGDPPRDTLDQIHQVKRDLLLLRSVAWPMRELVVSLQRDTHECISDGTRLYLRDLHDHVVQVIEITETFRERADVSAEPPLGDGSGASHGSRAADPGTLGPDGRHDPTGDLFRDAASRPSVLALANACRGPEVTQSTNPLSCNDRRGVDGLGAA